MSVAAIAIGRNEGQRLIRCLTSLKTQVERIVYVDSGSTDGSVQAAKELGVEVVLLDTEQPFTAARARNAGFEALKAGGLPEFVQFVDGDCGVAEDWVAAALRAFDGADDLALVTGWRSEIHPDASIYNKLLEVEWHQPEGDILACGGDMMVRSAAFDQVGGFNPVVIASEDFELCTRLRKAGHRLLRLPKLMTHHDANMTRFSQWWQRALRGGHGFAQVGDLHPEFFVAERRRSVLYGIVLPAAFLAGFLFSVVVPVLVLGVYLLSYLRTAQGLILQGLDRKMSRRLALFLSLSKFPELIGMCRFYIRKFLGRSMRIIEYK